VSLKPYELINVRNIHYQKQINHLNRVLNLLLIVTIALLSFTVYQKHTLTTRPYYIPTTPDGRVVLSPALNINHLELSKVKSLVDPKTDYIQDMPAPAKKFSEISAMGESGLIKYWVELAMRAIFEYDYIHYRKAIQKSRSFFSENGYSSFIIALNNSRNLETVKARQAIVYPKIGEIKIKSQTLQQGRLTWKIKVPLEIYYESKNLEEPLVQKLIGDISIARVSTVENPFYGLTIYKINFIEVF